MSLPGILIDRGLRRAGHRDLVAMDMTDGIIDRFRTMAIARAAVLTGHVLGSLIQTLVSSRSCSASPSRWASAPPPALAWLGAAGMLPLFAVALIWLSAALGSPARASRPPATPDVPDPLPFSAADSSRPNHAGRAAPVRPIPALHPGHRDRARTADRHAIGTNAIAAIAWSIGIALASYLWAVRLYNRRRAH